MSKVVPYSTSRTKVSNHILLDANEHYEQWVRTPLSVVSGMNRYPDRDSVALRMALAKKYCAPLSVENILITAGSIEAIDLLMLQKKMNRIVINTPSYDVYESRASIHGLKVIKIPMLGNGQPDVERTLRNSNDNDVLILINPNNPTGKLIHPKNIKNILNNFKGTVVIDEAYIEYAGVENSSIKFLDKHKNLIIFRTFSKAWGLAGIRLGYVLSSQMNIDQLRGMQSTYSVSKISQLMGLNAIEQHEQLKSNINKTIIEKAKVIRKLEALGFDVQDTDANFILIEIPNPEEIRKKLENKGILVRNRTGLGNKNLLRVTIGSKKENETLIKALSESCYA